MTTRDLLERECCIAIHPHIKADCPFPSKIIEPYENERLRCFLNSVKIVQAMSFVKTYIVCVCVFVFFACLCIALETSHASRGELHSLSLGPMRDEAYAIVIFGFESGTTRFKHHHGIRAPQ
jgi:hypothetical protein